MPATRKPRGLKSDAIKSSSPPYAKLSPGPGRDPSEVATHQRARLHSAMVDLVAERGYKAVTVRDLAQVAGVSTRTFYQHFDGKEDCFLHTHELVARRAVKRVGLAHAQGSDWAECLRFAFDAFVRELEEEPRAARLALIDAYLAGPAATGQVRRVERTFEEMVAESLSRAPDGLEVSRPLVEGVVAGVVRVARAWLQAKDANPIHSFGDQLLDWVLTYRGMAIVALPELDRESAIAAYELSPVSSSKQGGVARTPGGDRALILSAVAKLVVTEGYEELSLQRVRVATGISRRCFERNFDSIDDCLVSAVELRAEEALSVACFAGREAGTWEGGIYRTVRSLCVQIAQDPLLSRFCFVDLLNSLEAGMQCHERFMATLDELVVSRAPEDQCPGEVVEKASVGAVWSVIRHYASSGQAHQLPRVAATLSFLLLAPMVGPKAAVEAIETEQGELVKKHRAQRIDRLNDARNSRRRMEGPALRAPVPQGG